jgi:hypothetical protein
MKIMMRNHGYTALTTSALLTALVLSGCSAQPTSSSDGARAVSYGSVEAIAGDSAAVVTGTAGAQSTVRDLDDVTDFTLTEFTVESSEAQGDGAPSPGTTITVRQVGVVDNAPAPILESDQNYLLFITPSMLEGDLAAQYYVTGADAGLYVAGDAAKGAPATYTRLAPNEVDQLPEQLTLNEIP